MDKEKILDYVMNSPGNSNRAVLSGMLDESGGGNPNRIEIYEGTIANPFPLESNPGEVLQNIISAIENNNASVIVETTIGTLKGQLPATADPYQNCLCGFALSGQSASKFTSFRIFLTPSNDNVNVLIFDSYQGENGSFQYTDLKSIADTCPCKLTVIWHPLS